MSRHERLRLLDILDAIDRIGSYIEGMSYDGFLADRKTQDAVTRNIEIIGEAARALSDSSRISTLTFPGARSSPCGTSLSISISGYCPRSFGTSSRTNCRLSGRRSPGCDFANEQLQREDMGELIVVNEATGEHTNLPLMRTKTG